MGLLEISIKSRMPAGICHEFWGGGLCSHITDIDLTAFWDYYFKTITLSLQSGGCGATSRTHRDDITVVNVLKKHDSLREFLTKTFDINPILAHEKIKLEKTFIARHLSRIASLEIIWTDNLIGHVKLVDNDTKVYVFYHALFLEAQRWRAYFHRL
ncbi:hypothetical protein F4859DRAFT_517657 [Xylaria cf. heliscus]|nr:hypothetical protein F4859DRAFT_517657 [Xylaria cf. heliscus]